MNDQELRRLFRRIVVTVAPMPIALGAPGCGGAVTDSGQSDRRVADAGTGGAPLFVGRELSGGGPPSAYTGGMPNVGGTGGYGTFTGYGGTTAVFPGTGGTGGTGGFGGSTSYPGDAAPPPVDFCTLGAPGCGAYCLLASNVAVDAGVSTADAGPLSPAVCTAACGQTAYACSLLVHDAQRYVRCELRCVGGRRPEGLVGSVPSGRSHLGSYFESMARLEAASIPAFRTLRRELALHGAPRKLLRSARVAARDEIRHARATRELAARFGGRYAPPVIEPRPPRSIEALAIENAVEGCVRETFGAMMATWQAAVATDLAVRDAMRRIARDETRHAALALRVAKWAERRLGTDARRRVAEAKREAIATVFRELSYDVPAELASTAGVPSGAEARLMAAALEEQLWS